MTEAFDPIAYINEPRWQASRLGLDRIRELLDRLGRPQDKLRFVHVAGTNGKGSTCAYIASALRAAGLRTGQFSSPFIERFEERIRVDGEDIPADDLRTVTLAVREEAEAMAASTGDHPTEFELMTAVALVHFARQACDAVVLEVGLGGRLDSTNVIAAPDVAVIARIGLDHTAILGDTIAKIAGEKAGIIKPGSTVVSWPQEPEAMAVVRSAASAAGDALVVPDFNELEIGEIVHEGDVPLRAFRYRGVAYRTRLLGSYQPQNAALAIEALAALQARGWGVSDAAISQGVEQAEWPARFEVLPRIEGAPRVVVDGGHNPQGASALADSLRSVFPLKRAVLVMSVMHDKDYPAMLREVLPFASTLIATCPEGNDRALPAHDLAKAACRAVSEIPVNPIAGTEVVAAGSIADAVRLARLRAGSDGPICCFGSLYSVAETKRALRGQGLL